MIILKNPLHTPTVMAFLFPNRSTLIRLSFPTLDANNSEYYPLHAGHIASRL